MKKRAGYALLAIFAAAATYAHGKVWTEDDFVDKPYFHRPLVAIPSPEAAFARTVIGSTNFRQVQQGDTFLDIARYYGLGYNEMLEANPGVDPWVPPAGQAVLLPTEYILPRTNYEGVVVNIPEMRLFYYHPRAKGSDSVLVSTYPVGLGRDEWRTPQSKFKVRGKTVNPTWNIPASIRAERIKEQGFSETMVPGGSPDNPLGKYRIELTLNSYAIHGTNIPWGVGMQVSHGCVRLYPEDIEHIFPDVRVGAPGEFVYQPVKIGARDGDIYVEVHRDIYRLTPGPYREAIRLLDEVGWTDQIDTKRLQRAVEEESGVPMIISRQSASDDVEEEVVELPKRRRQY